MPGKSRPRKGKYSVQSKKRQGGTGQPANPVRPPAVNQNRGPVSASKTPLTRANIPTPMAKPAAVSHSYVATELRTIGILAGLILILLVVLAFALS